MAFGEYCCPYCDDIDFESEDAFFEHLCECNAEADELDVLGGLDEADYH